jgi:hypothetical protein
MYQSELDIPGMVSEQSLGFGLWYDADRLVLEGIYLDEITAYRARKRWIKTLESNFLLEEQHDFRIKVSLAPDSGRYQVRCDFTSACGRYAFWRLTHHQAPDVQCLLETAHLPSMSASPTFIDLPEEEQGGVGRPYVFSTPASQPDRPSASLLQGSFQVAVNVLRSMLRLIGRS